MSQTDLWCFCQASLLCPSQHWVQKHKTKQTSKKTSLIHCSVELTNSFTCLHPEGLNRHNPRRLGACTTKHTASQTAYAQTQSTHKGCPKGPLCSPYNNGLLQSSTGAWERRLASVGLALWLYRANVKDSPFYCGVGNTDHFGPQCFFSFWFCSVLFFKPSLQAEHVPSKSTQPKGGLKKKKRGCSLHHFLSDECSP